METALAPIGRPARTLHILVLGAPRKPWPIGERNGVVTNSQDEVVVYLAGRMSGEIIRHSYCVITVGGERSKVPRQWMSNTRGQIDRANLHVRVLDVERYLVRLAVDAPLPVILRTRVSVA